MHPARRGAVLVEAAAATLFLLIPLLVGIIQFGLFYSATNALSQATREGGRYAAVYGLTGTKNPDTPPSEAPVDVTDAYI
ncbi:MAG TPA: TadE family protein [Abditibacteriaceae bacterium]